MVFNFNGFPLWMADESKCRSEMSPLGYVDRGNHQHGLGRLCSHSSVSRDSLASGWLFLIRVLDIDHGVL